MTAANASDSAARSPVVPPTETGVDEAARAGADARRRSSGVVGATSGTSAIAARVAGLRRTLRTPQRQVGTIRPLAPALGQRPRERRRAPGQHEVGVHHHHDRARAATASADVEDARDRRPAAAPRCPPRG
jgi:hypothetical protein